MPPDRTPAYACADCDASFLSIEHLGNHLFQQSHSVICAHCSLRFTDAFDLKDHWAHLNHHPTSCSECRADFASPADCDAHRASSACGRIECEFCRRVFVARGLFDEHACGGHVPVVKAKKKRRAATVAAAAAQSRMQPVQARAGPVASRGSSVSSIASKGALKTVTNALPASRPVPTRPRMMQQSSASLKSPSKSLSASQASQGKPADISGKMPATTTTAPSGSSADIAKAQSIATELETVVETFTDKAVAKLRVEVEKYMSRQLESITAGKIAQPETGADHQSITKMYSCAVCKQVLGTAVELSKHIRVWSHYSFKCTACGQGFEDQAELTEHCELLNHMQLISFDEDGPLLVDIASPNRNAMSTSKYAPLTASLTPVAASPALSPPSLGISQMSSGHSSVDQLREKGHAGYYCHVCGKHSDSAAEAAQHEAIHPRASAKARCGTCSTICKTVEAMATHQLQFQHFSYHCSTCDEVLLPGTLHVHSQQMSQTRKSAVVEFRCQVCKRVFDDISAISKHMNLWGHLQPPHTAQNVKISGTDSINPKESGPNASLHTAAAIGAVVKQVSKPHLHPLVLSQVNLSLTSPYDDQTLDARVVIQKAREAWASGNIPAALVELATLKKPAGTETSSSASHYHSAVQTASLSDGPDLAMGDLMTFDEDATDGGLLISLQAAGPDDLAQASCSPVDTIATPTSVDNDDFKGLRFDDEESASAKKVVASQTDLLEAMSDDDLGESLLQATARLNLSDSSSISEEIKVPEQRRSASASGATGFWKWKQNIVDYISSPLLNTRTKRQANGAAGSVIQQDVELSTSSETDEATGSVSKSSDDIDAPLTGQGDDKVNGNCASDMKSMDPAIEINSLAGDRVAQEVSAVVPLDESVAARLSVTCLKCGGRFHSHSLVAMHLETGRCQATPATSIGTIYRDLRDLDRDIEDFTFTRQIYHLPVDVQGPVECHLCTAVFADATALNAHYKVETHDAELYSCPGCETRFSTMTELLEHVEDEEPLGILRIFNEFDSLWSTTGYEH